MSKLWRNVCASIASAVRNTPVEVMIAVAVASVVSLAIMDVIDDNEVVGRILLTAFLALCAIFATSASAALRVFDARTRWVLTTVVAVASPAYGALILDADHLTELWRWAFLAVAAVMAVMLVPVAARLGEVTASERFWRYNIRLLSRVAVAGAYAFALYIGVVVGIVAIGELFDLSINDDIYGHLFAWIVLGLGTVLALGGLNEVKRIGEPFTDATILWSGRLGTFLFMPLVLMYLGIMYAYLGKVVVTGVVPSNVLSPLALGAGILGYFGLFVLQPHMHREDFKPLARLLRAFPAAFVPIVPFGVWAVWQRVAQYGWTEFRYARMAALVCLGLFSLIGAYKWLRKREFSLVTGPALLGVLAFLGAVGPWGASYVSEASQMNRLTQALERAQLIAPDGHLLSKEEVVGHAADPEAAATAREALEYLIEAHGEESIADLTTVDLSKHERAWQKVEALGFANFDAPVRAFSVYADRNAPFHFSAPGLVTDFSVSDYGSDTTRGFAISLDGAALVMSRGPVEGRVLLDDLFDEQARDTSRQVAAVELVRPLRSPTGDIVGEVALRDVSFQLATEGVRVTYVGGIVVFHD